MGLCLFIYRTSITLFKSPHLYSIYFLNSHQPSIFLYRFLFRNTGGIWKQWGSEFQTLNYQTKKNPKCLADVQCMHGFEFWPLFYPKHSKFRRFELDFECYSENGIICKTTYFRFVCLFFRLGKCLVQWVFE